MSLHFECECGYCDPLVCSCAAFAFHWETTNKVFVKQNVTSALVLLLHTTKLIVCDLQMTTFSIKIYLSIYRSIDLSIYLSSIYSHPKKTQISTNETHYLAGWCQIVLQQSWARFNFFCSFFAAALPPLWTGLIQMSKEAEIEFKLVFLFGVLKWDEEDKH